MRGAQVLLLVVLLAPLVVAQEAEPEWPLGRWNPYGHVPILVFIDTSNLTERTIPYADEVRGAWAWWAAGGNGALSWSASFEETSAREDADILVWFVEADHVLCENDTPGAGCGGFGLPEYGLKGEIYLATLDGYVPPEGSNQMAPDGWTRIGSPQHVTFDAMRSVARHELGHALGLDHSDDPSDIMHEGWEGFRTDGYRPESLLTPAQTSLFAGIGFAALLVFAGGLFVVHRYRDGRARRMLRDIEVEHDPPPARSVIETPTMASTTAGPYVRVVRCSASPNGEHAFEHATLDGESWLVCRACRFPTRL